MVRGALIAAWPELEAPGATEIVPIRTTGDRTQDQGRPLAEVGGKGLFTKEMDEALLAHRIDIAVHCIKDIPTWLPDPLEIGAVLTREDPRDALIAAPGISSIAELPTGTVFGTCSLRRQSQLLAARPDLIIRPLRGNVDTRLRKVADSEVHATVLAVAGLKRLSMLDRANAVLEAHELLPAVGQGALGIENRKNDERARMLIRPIADRIATIAIDCERALLAELDGSCRTPIGGLAEIHGGRVRLEALVARPDGRGVWRTRREGPLGDAVELGRDAGRELRRVAAPQVFVG
jgi:hydroxymethylbilane synthase